MAELMKDYEGLVIHGNVDLVPRENVIFRIFLDMYKCSIINAGLVNMPCKCMYLHTIY